MSHQWARPRAPAHRDGARLVTTARWLSPATIKTFDQELTAMVERGFTPVLALRTIAALSRYVTGFVLQEQAERHEHAAVPAEQLAALADLLEAGTSATLLTAIQEGGHPLGEEAFEHGLRTPIDGAAAELARHAPAAVDHHAGLAGCNTAAARRLRSFTYQPVSSRTARRRGDGQRRSIDPQAL